MINNSNFKRLYSTEDAPLRNSVYTVCRRITTLFWIRTSNSDKPSYLVLQTNFCFWTEMSPLRNEFSPRRYASITQSEIWLGLDVILGSAGLRSAFFWEWDHILQHNHVYTEYAATLSPASRIPDSSFKCCFNRSEFRWWAVSLFTFEFLAAVSPDLISGDKCGTLCAEAKVNLLRIWDASHMTDTDFSQSVDARTQRTASQLSPSCVNGLYVKCKLCRSVQPGVVLSK